MPSGLNPTPMTRWVVPVAEHLVKGKAAGDGFALLSAEELKQLK